MHYNYGRFPRALIHKPLRRFFVLEPLTRTNRSNTMEGICARHEITNGKKEKMIIFLKPLAPPTYI